MNVKEVTVFSPGDSKSLTCWSNVPYLLTKTLEDKGIKVNRVNIYSNKYIRKTVWRYAIAPIINRLYGTHAYDYDHTRFNRWLIRRKIERAGAKYPNTDLNILVSYDYLATNTKAPNLLFCDWTFEYLCKRYGKEPCGWERAEITRQKKIIENADYVVSLFPDAAAYMREKYDNKNIYYLGQNVINNVYGELPDPETIIKAKGQSPLLLFIGREGYLEGAKMLIKSFSSLKKRFPALELHIIGLSQDNFDALPEDVFCHGYLNKSNDKERSIYYDLVLRAKLFINPTPLWGGYSASIEAMYFYTPVIVSDYSSFVDTFGNNISFGQYLTENDPSALAEIIRSLLEKEADEYATLCANAHKAVHAFTWDAYIDKLLSLVK